MEREDAGFGILFWIEGCKTRIGEGWKDESVGFLFYF
jgi:hypothetical protein